jgi:hypothetical protein
VLEAVEAIIVTRNRRGRGLGEQSFGDGWSWEREQRDARDGTLAC